MAWLSWIRWTLCERDDEAVVDRGRRGHLAAVVAGEPDRQQPPSRRLGEGGHQVARASARREGHRDVTVARVGDDLPREDELEAHVVAERGQHGLIGGQVQRRQRTAADRLREQSRRASRRRSSFRRCRTRTAGHRRRTARPSPRRTALDDRAHIRERRPLQRRALAGLGPRRRGQVGQQRPESRSSASMNGYRKAGALGASLLIGTSPPPSQSVGQQRRRHRRARAAGRRQRRARPG